MNITQNQVSLLRECQLRIDALIENEEYDGCDPIFDVMNQTMVDALGFDLTEQILSDTAFPPGCDPVEVIGRHVELVIVDGVDVISQVDAMDLLTRL